MDKKEYRKKLDALGKRKGLIPGVHNYCDRWCERCPFTSKCGSYALTEGLDEGQESYDLENEKFWNDLSMIFEVTFDMLKEKAEELGIDLEDIKDTDYEHEFVENDAMLISREYGKKITEWIKSNTNDLYNTAERLQLVNKDEVVKLKDAVEVIQWYSFFISAKVYRAFMDYGSDEDEDFEYDRLGSSKIAVIAMDRSIAALGYILEKMPDTEDDILPLMADLSRVKKFVLKTFPKAMEFKRPGFDN